KSMPSEILPEPVLQRNIQDSLHQSSAPYYQEYYWHEQWMCTYVTIRSRRHPNLKCIGHPEELAHRQNLPATRQDRSLHPTIRYREHDPSANRASDKLLLRPYPIQFC